MYIKRDQVEHLVLTRSVVRSDFILKGMDFVSVNLIGHVCMYTFIDVLLHLLAHKDTLSLM